MLFYFRYSLPASTDFVMGHQVPSCYCYVICHDSVRQISVFENKFIKGGIEIYLMPIDITDPQGTETLYIMKPM